MLAFFSNKAKISVIGLKIIPLVLHHIYIYLQYVNKFSFLRFSFFAKAKLSGRDEGSLSSESDRSDDEYEQSKGRWCFCILKVVLRAV